MAVTTTDFAKALLRGYIVIVVSLILIPIPIAGFVVILVVAPFLGGHEGARKLPESWSTFYGLVAGTLWALVLVGTVIVGLDFLAAAGIRLQTLEKGLLALLAALQVLLFWWGARTLYGRPAPRASRGRRRYRATDDGLDLEGLGELRRRHGEIVEWGGGAAPGAQAPLPTSAVQPGSERPSTPSSPPAEPGPETTEAPPPAPASKERWVQIPSEPSIPTARVWTGPQPSWPRPQPEPSQSGAVPGGQGRAASKGSRRRPLFKPRGASRRSRRTPDEAKDARTRSSRMPETTAPQPMPQPGVPITQSAYPFAGPPPGGQPPSMPGPTMPQAPPSPPPSEPTPSLRDAPRLSPLQELQRLKAQRARTVEGLVPRSGTAPPPAPSRPSTPRPATTSPPQSSSGLSFTPSPGSKADFDGVDIVAPTRSETTPSSESRPATSSPASAPSPPSPSPSSTPPPSSPPETLPTEAPAPEESKPIGVMDMLGAVARGAITGFSEAASAIATEPEPKTEADASPTKADKVDQAEPKDQSGSAIDAAVADVAAETKKGKK